jgi:Spy/CpxP family protein refolding chaperone
MKKLMLFLCLVCLAAPLAAQPGPMMRREGGPPVPPDAALKSAGLTDAQISAVHDLVAARDAKLADVRPQLGPAHEAVHAALETQTPDPATVGKAAIAAHALETKVRAADTEFRTAFEALLTPEQGAALKVRRPGPPPAF